MDDFLMFHLNAPLPGVLPDGIGHGAHASSSSSAPAPAAPVSAENSDATACADSVDCVSFAQQGSTVWKQSDTLGIWRSRRMVIERDRVYFYSEKSAGARQRLGVTSPPTTAPIAGSESSSSRSLFLSGGTVTDLGPAVLRHETKSFPVQNVRGAWEVPDSHFRRTGGNCFVIHVQAAEDRGFFAGAQVRLQAVSAEERSLWVKALAEVVEKVRADEEAKRRQELAAAEEAKRRQRLAAAEEAKRRQELAARQAAADEATSGSSAQATPVEALRAKEAQAAKGGQKGPKGPPAKGLGKGPKGQPPLPSSDVPKDGMKGKGKGKGKAPEPAKLWEGLNGKKVHMKAVSIDVDLSTTIFENFISEPSEDQAFTQEVQDMFTPKLDDKFDRIQKQLSAKRASAATKVTLLDDKAALNLEVVLKKLEKRKVSMEELRNSLQQFDFDCCLEAEDIQRLLAALPPTEQLLNLLQYSGDTCGLRPTEEKLLRLAKVPRLTQRLQILGLRKDLLARRQRLLQETSTVRNACQELRASILLRDLLEVILRMVMFVDHGVQRLERNTVRGFDITSALKIAEFKATGEDGSPSCLASSKFTGMHFVVSKVMQKRQLSWQVFMSEISALKESSSLNLRSVVKDAAEFSKEASFLMTELCEHRGTYEAAAPAPGPTAMPGPAVLPGKPPLSPVREEQAVPNEPLRVGQSELEPQCQQCPAPCPEPSSIAFPATCSPANSASSSTTPSSPRHIVPSSARPAAVVAPAPSTWDRVRTRVGAIVRDMKNVKTPDTAVWIREIQPHKGPECFQWRRAYVGLGSILEVHGRSGVRILGLHGAAVLPLTEADASAPESRAAFPYALSVCEAAAFPRASLEQPLYLACRSQGERERWCSVLQKAAEQVGCGWLQRLRPESKFRAPMAAPGWYRLSGDCEKMLLHFRDIKDAWKRPTQPKERLRLATRCGDHIAWHANDPALPHDVAQLLHSTSSSVDLSLCFAVCGHGAAWHFFAAPTGWALRQWLKAFKELAAKHRPSGSRAGSEPESEPQSGRSAAGALCPPSDEVASSGSDSKPDSGKGCVPQGDSTADLSSCNCSGGATVPMVPGLDLSGCGGGPGRSGRREACKELPEAPQPFLDQYSSAASMDGTDTDTADDTESEADSVTATGPVATAESVATGESDSPMGAAVTPASLADVDNLGRLATERLTAFQKVERLSTNARLAEVEIVDAVREVSEEARSTMLYFGQKPPEIGEGEDLKPFADSLQHFLKSVNMFAKKVVNVWQEVEKQELEAARRKNALEAASAAKEAAETARRKNATEVASAAKEAAGKGGQTKSVSKGGGKATGKAASKAAGKGSLAKYGSAKGKGSSHLDKDGASLSKPAQLQEDSQPATPKRVDETSSAGEPVAGKEEREAASEVDPPSSGVLTIPLVKLAQAEVHVEDDDRTLSAKSETSQGEIDDLDLDDLIADSLDDVQSILKDVGQASKMRDTLIEEGSSMSMSSPQECGSAPVCFHLPDHDPDEDEVDSTSAPMSARLLLPAVEYFDMADGDSDTEDDEDDNPDWFSDQEAQVRRQRKSPTKRRHSRKEAEEAKALNLMD